MGSKRMFEAAEMVGSATVTILAILVGGGSLSLALWGVLELLRIASEATARTEYLVAGSRALLG